MFIPLGTLLLILIGVVVVELSREYRMDRLREKYPAGYESLQRLQAKN